MTLPVALAPTPAPAPAARSARAAAPAPGESTDCFEVLVARSVEASMAECGAPDAARLGDEEESIDRGSVRDEMADIAFVAEAPEPRIQFITPTPAGEQAPVATVTEPPAESGHVTVVAMAASAQDEESIATPTEARPEAPTAAPAVDLAPQNAPAPVVTPKAPVSDESAPDLGTVHPGPFPRSQQLEPAETNTVGPSPTVSSTAGESEWLPGARVGPDAVSRSVPMAVQTRATARSAGHAIVAAAMAHARAPQPVPTAEATRVATAPLPARSDIPIAGAVAAPAAPATPRAQSAPADNPSAAAESVVVAPASGQPQASGRDGGQKHPHQDPGPAGLRESAPQRAALPASMIFPGQATFAAALEHAGPLAPGLPPAFAAQAFDTVVPQIVRSMQLQVTAGGGEMKMTLTPEHLGTVTIELRVDQQRVSASLGADTPAVRMWIAAHEQDLKAGLADLGLQLDEFVVRDDDPREQQNQGDGKQPHPRRRRAKSDESVFEIKA